MRLLFHPKIEKIFIAYKDSLIEERKNILLILLNLRKIPALSSGPIRNVLLFLYKDWYLNGAYGRHANGSNDTPQKAKILIFWRV
jgi:hypothetical protein